MRTFFPEIEMQVQNERGGSVLYEKSLKWVPDILANNHTQEKEMKMSVKLGFWTRYND